jgi:hypothetical protein
MLVNGSIPTTTQITAAVLAALAPSLQQVNDLARKEGLIIGNPVQITPSGLMAANLSQVYSVNGTTVTVTRTL